MRRLAAASSFITPHSSFRILLSVEAPCVRHNRDVPTTPDTTTRFLPGVGPGRAKVLDEHELRTAGDLLWYFPYRYEDRRHPTRIADLGRHVDQPVLLRGKVI